MTDPQRVQLLREKRLRYRATRKGLRLEKSRYMPAYAGCTYQLVDRATGTVVSSRDSAGFGLSLDDIARELDQP